MMTLFSEDFEDDGNGTRYTTSVAEFSDGTSDYFLRTDGTGIAGSNVYNAPSGNFFFAAQDLDGEGGPTTVTVDFTGIDIGGFENLTFAGLFAEDDAGDGNQDWDADALVFVEVSIDGGAFEKILQFASQGATNTEPGLDTDFDGVADGAALTDIFTEFTAAIAGTGTTLDLRLTISGLDAGDEDIAFDNLRITGDALVQDPVITINEIDADTAGTDTLEFVELYDGGVGNTALDGLVVVFFNGSDDASYEAFDLDGFTTNAEGYFVLGNVDVANVGLVFGSNTLQNGADAVAVFTGDAADFPNDTPVTMANLVDAIVYDTNDADDAGLLAGLGQTVQYNEGANGDSAADALARVPDGSGDFFAQAPTPGAANAMLLDIVAPILVATDPADDAVNVNPASNLVFTFDEVVIAGGGNITLFNAADDTIVEIIDVMSAQASFDGVTLTIDPLADLAANMSFYVQVDDGAVTDISGNAFAGIADDMTFDFTTAAAPVVGEAVIFINEFHYDNAGGDVGEFVEVAGTAGLELAGYSIVFYNGNNGEAYATLNLSGVLGDQSNGFGFADFDQAGIQNGAPDGLALVDADGMVIEFLSYEGSFTAVGGAADGLTSVDIGVAELGTTPEGFSLQRTGTGSSADEFTFVDPQAETRGMVNTGQTFVRPEPVIFINEFHYDNAGGDVGEFVEVAGTAGLDLTGYSIVFYNGNNGEAYATLNLSGVLANQSNGFGFADFDQAGIQNGAPDGLALVDADGMVIEFLSYEGSFTAVGGAADGLTSMDIGVAELGTTPEGFSLQRVGTGTSADAFTFADPQAETRGMVNTGQTFAQQNDDMIAPMLVASDPADDAIDAEPAANITLTFDEAVTAGMGTITLFNGTDDTIIETFDVSGGNVSFADVTVSINPTADLALLSDFYLLVDEGAITDIAGNAFAGIADPTDLNFTTRGELRIGTVQGDNDISPFEGRLVTITGVVVGDYQSGNGADGDLGGFYIQDPFGDGDVTTSDGIFIFTGMNNALDVSHGDTVTVTGIVEENFNQTQVNAEMGSFSIDSSGFDISTLLTTIDFSTIGTTTDDDGDLIADLEAFEGMLVNFAQTITVVGNDNLDNFGEVTGSAAGRLFQFTQENAPDAAGFAAHLEFVASQTFIIDDGFNGSGNPIQRPDGEFTEADEFRLGDTSADLFGVLGYGFDNFRLRPVDLDEDGNPYDDVTFDNTNPRPDGPPDVGGTIQVASMNVLNFFTSLDEPGTSTELGFDPRGADNQTEFDRQLDKLVSSVIDSEAEVYGLVEIENDFNGLANNGAEDAIQVLVDALNARAGEGTYAFVDPGRDFVSSDAISNAFVYDTTKIKIADGTSVAILDDAAVQGLAGFEGAPPIFDGVNTNRPAIAVTFEEIATGETFTVVVNHFKSKGGNGNGDDADIGDGQAAFNGTRVRAAEAIQAWLATNPTGTTDGDYLIIGDLNAYAQEDPIRSFLDNGFVDLAAGEGEYSFEFANQLGTLDYGLANASLQAQVTGAAHYHVNADEPEALDYNTGIGDDTLFNGDTPVRHADHDPLLVGLNLNQNVIDTPVRGNLFLGTDGNDRIIASDNGDRIFAGSGDDTVTANGGNDLVFGKAGNDTIDAGAGNDLVFGGSGNDFILGGAGRDTLRGDAGDDILFGGEGSDHLRGDRGADMLAGEEGADRLFGGSGDDLLFGGTGRDQLFGQRGDDTLDGGEGDDTLHGGQGDDNLNGGAGNDLLFGNLGSDTFFFADGDGHDRLFLFDARDDDEKIDLSAVTEITDFDDLVSNHLSTSFGGALITYGDSSVQLIGVRASALDESDFVF